jgi:lipopolysaccharide biosynthesis regulator YciM
MKQIDDAMNKDNRPYFNAASYYYDNGKDLNQALTWVNKAIETNKDAFFMFMLKARIHLKLGDKAAAKTAANSTIELATKAKNDDYVKMATELIAGLQ